MKPREPSQVQDRELVEAVLNGDKAAQREFYDRHVDRVYGLAYRMTGQETSARDCTQTAFIRLFDKLRTFRGEAALSTWVHAVAVSVILDWRRSTARHRQREVQVDAVDELAGPALEFDVAVIEALRQAIDKLSSRYRTVVVLHDIEGYTHDEIGAALGIGVGTSKVRLSRARKKLKEALADYAGAFAYERS